MEKLRTVISSGEGGVGLNWKRHEVIFLGGGNGLSLDMVGYIGV